MLCYQKEVKNRSKKDLKRSLVKTLDIVNHKLDTHQRLHNLIIVNDDWTVENRFLTPTMKIKRNLIEKSYNKNYEDWYNAEQVLIIE